MTKSLFQKFAPLSGALKGLVGNRASPFGVPVDRVLSPTEAIIGGRPTILAGTFNYLGLTFDPACIAAAKAALDRDGTGTTGSRIANGNYGVHGEIEQALARFLGRSSAMLFTTGYQANLGILSTVVGPEDYVLLDADCHASIYDGLKMGNATVIRFRHNDAQDLDRRLQRLSGEKGDKLIVIEGIYSMLGDRAPLSDFVEVKRRHGAYLLIDEAHSLGVLGARGRGLAEADGLESDVDFVVGTFSKSLGAIGGYCASDDPDFELMRIACRPYMYTASLPPSVVASCLAALRQVETRPELMRSLWRNANRFHAGLSSLGFTLCAEPSPIVSVRLPDPATAYAFWHELLDLGVFVTLAVPPATPNGWCILRSSVCAAHSEEQIERMIECYGDVAARLGLQRPAKAAVGT
ncbi:MAG TPA: aminotransferase class I/II-fold pyridoxal phosphate-dependent enzyme [Alphaproteobacteria bacterium]|nr:aminotransferase class I/II-fold pyridoxal phosphate-dependent enzyme [Alphaproteobacteria bacterium]